jgi:hypothetical protein
MDVKAAAKSVPSCSRFSLIFATARLPSVNVLARISPKGGGIARAYASVAAAKSWRLREMSEIIGHAIIPNTADITMPAELAYGKGMRPIIGGRDDWTALVSIFPPINMMSNDAPKILPTAGRCSIRFTTKTSEKRLPRIARNCSGSFCADSTKAVS